MKGRRGIVVSVYRRVEKVFSGALEVVLFLETAEQAASGAEVRNCALLAMATASTRQLRRTGERTACGNGYASASDDHDLLLAVDNLHDALELFLLVIVQLAVGLGRVQV